MSRERGVPVTDLRCPTCGRAYKLPLEVHHPPDAPDLQAFGRREIKGPSEPPFLECAAGHRWTLKTIFRREGQPDAVLLGDYIGGGS